ncbi:ABC transporter ATP-binding protein [Blastococcus sp. URHD0036]|uniref:ABC transporter ATP-binding protein n=1 Tax=Blastococcus sp. URHD0036 TaxID=1380356 RepID=UPI0004960837|nr:ABC transporter ATP-binding protein [Blastococcus sp. URHD0036]
MLIPLLRRFLRPMRGLLAGVVVFQAIQAVANLYLPSLNADIIDEGVATGDIGRVLTLGGLMLGVTLIQVAAAVAAAWFGARTAMLVGRDVRLALFRRVGSFSSREMGAFGAPSLITRSTNDVQQVQMLVLMSCVMLVPTPILAIGGVVFAVHEDPGLSWVIAVAVPIMLAAVLLVTSRMRPHFERLQVRIDTINRVLREQLTGMRVIRAFVREPQETARFADANAAVTESALRAGRLFAFVFPLVTLVLNVSSVAVIWFGAARVEDGSLQVGSLIAFLSYLVQILMAVMMASLLALMLPRAAVSAGRIDEVLRTEPTVLPPATAVVPEEPSGVVELRGATFAYPGAERPVLRDVSFTAEPGRTTAVVGSTGSGKTTLVGLIPRLVDVTAGAVLMDGVDVRELAPAHLWSRVGLVEQKAFLFSGTVASNLRYGRPEATEQELWAALEIAQAADFVRALPDRLEAPVSQGGTNLSGGQRQRLSIARALVARPQVYLFDDAFSALDTATDARLRAALAREVAGATVIVVAQRIATVLDADLIIVLEDGRVIGQGTHTELMATCPEYAEIVASQALPEEQLA